MRARDIYLRLHVENKNLQRIYPTGTTVKQQPEECSARRHGKG